MDGGVDGRSGAAANAGGDKDVDDDEQTKVQDVVERKNLGRRGRRSEEGNKR